MGLFELFDPFEHLRCPIQRTDPDEKGAQERYAFFLTTFRSQDEIKRRDAARSCLYEFGCDMPGCSTWLPVIIYFDNHNHVTDALIYQGTLPYSAIKLRWDQSQKSTRYSFWDRFELSTAEHAIQKRLISSNAQV